MLLLQGLCVRSFLHSIDGLLKFSCTMQFINDNFMTISELRTNSKLQYILLSFDILKINLKTKKEQTYSALSHFKNQLLIECFKAIRFSHKCFLTRRRFNRTKNKLCTKFPICRNIEDFCNLSIYDWIVML